MARVRRGVRAQRTCRSSPGSTRVLKAMRRTYGRERYLALVDTLRAAIPDLALATDIIVGFPGETEADFERDARGRGGGPLRRRLHVRLQPATRDRGGDDARPDARGASSGSGSSGSSTSSSAIAARAERGARRRGWRRCSSRARAGPTHELLRGRTRRNTTVNFHGRAAPGRSRPRRDRRCDVDDVERHRGSLGRRLTARVSGHALRHALDTARRAMRALSPTRVESGGAPRRQKRLCLPRHSAAGGAVSGFVLAIFGPTASGKTAVAEALADRVDAELVSADAMQVYRGLPILTNQSERPTRLVGIWPLDHEGSVGEYQRLAHAAIDEILTAGRVPVVTGGTGLYLRAALADLELPPRRRPGRVPAGAPVRRGGRGTGARRARRPRPRCRRRGSPQRPPPRRPRARAGGGRRLATARARPALDRRDPPSDACRRSRRPGRGPRRAHREAHPRDVRAGGRRRDEGRARRRALRDRPGDDRAGGVRHPSRRTKPSPRSCADTAVRRLPAQVDAAPPGRC